MAIINTEQGTHPKKISTEFALRLASFDPQQKITVITLLNTGDTANNQGKRQTRAERKTAIEAMQKSADRSLQNIEPIIQKHDGQKLADKPDILGSIPIEITVAGIKSLCESDSVKAIMENQKIKLSQ
ncbi:MAG: hypothetical protein QNJ54_14975 [Prochloraceae cyanobacterium]|nr:hypothetical protein [Prochloraceae cyanobacterium]